MNKCYIIIALLAINFGAFCQCNFCGTYKNKFGDSSQKLVIKSDSTFYFEWNGIMASLLSGETTGKWQVNDNTLILQSEYSKKDFEIIMKRINYCETEIDPYLMNLCDSLLRIRVKNFKGEDIWFLYNVMINDDESNIHAIGFNDLYKDEPSNLGAFFKTDKVDKISIFDNWFLYFEETIANEDSNDITIIGNFSNETYYKYFDDEKWKISNCKLKGNKQFGDFIKTNKNGY